MSDGRRLRAFTALAGNRALLRVLAAYLLFTLTENAVWIAMLVYAYGRGGATTAGLIAVAQLVPAAVAAPVMASAADRRSPVILLAGGYLAQAVAMAGTAAAIGAAAPLAAYAAAVVAATVVTATRPAQSALIPSVSATPDQLTAANVVTGWLDAAGVAVAGLLAGVLISLAGAGSVFAVCAGLGLLAALLVAGLRAAPLGAASLEPAPLTPAPLTPAPLTPAPLTPAPAGEAPADVPAQAPAQANAAEAEADAEDETATAGIGAGLRLAASQPRLRLMLALLTADAVVLGALDLLAVILAVAVLRRPAGWAGYLEFAFGLGAVLAATGSAALIGRRLGGPVLAAALAFSAALAAIASGPGVTGTVALLIAAGASHCVLDVAARTLLQRSVPPQLLGRIFGVLEGAMMAGLAVGALLVSALDHLGGSRLAVLGVAAVLPLAAAAGGRAVFRLDAGATVPVVQIALLRSLPLFAGLPAPALEGLAAALEPVLLNPGDIVIRQGDPGDAYYAIAAGELDASQDGRWLGRFGRGEGVGEIALLRDIPRTATVTARTAATVYQLDREPFLTAVIGHAPTQRQAGRIAATRLANPASPHPVPASPELANPEPANPEPA
ncbi:MAG: MFS transporter [Streptosporangiaceae bacterium]